MTNEPTITVKLPKAVTSRMMRLRSGVWIEPDDIAIIEPEEGRGYSQPRVKITLKSGRIISLDCEPGTTQAEADAIGEHLARVSTRRVYL